MKKNRFCMVSLSVVLVVMLTILPAFATYSVFDDTEITEVVPIYYTEDYYPGLIRELEEAGIALFANASYGSYSQSGFASYVNHTPSVGNSTMFALTNSTPVVSVSSSGVVATYSNILGVANTSSSFMIFTLDENAYFDFQSSYFSFTQDSAQADTFVLDGTFTFKLQNLYSVTQRETSTFYGALDPIAVQLLVDGRPYGDIIDISSYSSPFTGAFAGTPANATVTFDDFKVYGVESAPEQIGFRVYVSSNYNGSTKSLTANAPLSTVNVSNTLRVISQPTITYEKESTASDEDLNGILEGIRNFISLLTDASTGLSWSERIFRYIRSDPGSEYLFSTGGVATSTGDASLAWILRNGLMGLGNLLRANDGNYLNYNGDVLSITSGYLGVDQLLQRGFVGLSQHIKIFDSAFDTLSAYIRTDSFSWQDYNLETHELDEAQILTGQNELFGTALQSIEENLGRLAYVFASDEEIQLKDDADPGLGAFKDTFGGGAKAKDIVEIGSTVSEVQGMFDTGFGIGDLFDSLNGDSSWFSWFTAETANALDSTPAVMTVGDEDPFNHQTYYDHVNAVEELRSREEVEE